MKAVVTGGSGFIGGFIAMELAKEPNTEVVIFDVTVPDFRLTKNMTYRFGDVRNRQMLDDTIQGADEVYNCASLLGTAELIEISAIASDINITGLINVLDSCKKHEVARVFHPTKPMFAHDAENTYTITKFASEKFCQMYQEQFGMSVAVLRWLNATGPRQHLFPIRKVIPSFCIFGLNGIPIEIYGDGEQTVDIIDVRDIAIIAIRACRELGKFDEIIEVGLGEKVTINALATKIADKIEVWGETTPKVEIQHVPMRRGEAKNTNIVADISNLKRALPDYSPQYLIDDCLSECVAYYSRLSKIEVLNALHFYNKGG